MSQYLEIVVLLVTGSSHLPGVRSLNFWFADQYPIPERQLLCAAKFKSGSFLQRGGPVQHDGNGVGRRLPNLGIDQEPAAIPRWDIMHVQRIDA